VHSERTIRAALEFAGAGWNPSQIATQIGIPRSMVRDWLGGAIPHVPRSLEGYRCRADHEFGRLGPTYVYLLGLYLGDGCISAHARGVYRLRIVLDVKYPGIIEAAAAALAETRGGKANVLTRPKNCVEVSSYWQHWPCLFPQHGPGKKHERPIQLADRQQELASRWPQPLLRGLIESDGCRFQNTGTRWSWPRYSFMNRSADIRSIFCRACDRLGLRWTASGGDTIYVSRKADVAKLDEFIGPKQ
jgi:hypothetical protein